jgi:carbonic anhydrase/acetyltransferase-like protein (isoleucine patch superfamily)
MLYSFKNKQPVIGQDTFVSDEATLIGDVRIGNKCYIGPGAVLRGDYGTIEIGNCSAIEDNVVIHSAPGSVCKIGSRVIVGHGAIIHSLSIDDEVLVGMGSIISIDARIGAKSIIAEGAVVRMRQIIPPSVVVGGNPAKVVKQLPEDAKPTGKYDEDLYMNLALDCLQGSLKKIDSSSKP